MATIVEFRKPGERPIDVATLQDNLRKLKTGLIAPAVGEVLEPEIVEDHTADPIKSLEDIKKISRFLKESGRYRDNMLFIVGINFGLRVSDLVTLRFSHLIDENFMFKDRFAILEKKTKNTRKRKRNRYITINAAVMEAVTLYLETSKTAISLNDYMFTSRSNHKSKEDKPLTRGSVDRILKGIAEDLQLSCKISTHSLRKTFGYHQMVMSGNDPRKLLLLQKIFGHSTSAQTLDYIGITSEEIDEAYLSLNLGGEKYDYLVDSAIGESEEVVKAG